MPRDIQPTTADQVVVARAAEIVSAAIDTAVRTALQAAAVCGCPGCRATAERTAVWAAAMLPDPIQPTADGR